MLFRFTLGRRHQSKEAGGRNLPKKAALSPEQETVELLRTALIVQLKQLGLVNKKIRKIVGCGMNRVDSVLTNLPKEKKKNGR